MKAVIEKVRDNVSAYQTPNGQFFVHMVTVNGKEYEYHSKSETCEKFKQGEEAHFDFKDVDTKRGVSHRIVPVQAPFGGGKSFSGGKKYEPKDENRITYLSCLSSICTLYAQSSKINDFEKILADAEKAYQEAIKHSSK